MDTLIRDRLDHLGFLGLQTRQHVLVFPVRSDARARPPWGTLHRADGDGRLGITLEPGPGEPGEVRMHNRGDVALLAVAGEELTGATGGCFVASSTLIEAHRETWVPIHPAPGAVAVSHRVELRPAGRLAPVVERAACMAASSRALAERSGLMHSLPPRPPGFPPMPVAMPGSGEPSLAECESAFPCVPGQMGLLVVINGVMSGFDVCGHPETYEALHPALLASHVLPALRHVPQRFVDPMECAGEAQRFLAEVGEGRRVGAPSTGPGTEYRWLAPGLAGAALLAEGELVHLTCCRIPVPTVRNI